VKKEEKKPIGVRTSKEDVMFLCPYCKEKLNIDCGTPDINLYRCTMCDYEFSEICKKEGVKDDFEVYSGRRMNLS